VRPGLGPDEARAYTECGPHHLPLHRLKAQPKTQQPVARAREDPPHRRLFFFHVYAYVLGGVCLLHLMTGDWLPPVTLAAHLLPYFSIVALIAIPLAWPRAQRLASLELLGSGILGLFLSLPMLAGGQAPLSQGEGRLLRIRTWNVGDGRANAEEIAEALTQVEADVVCLQELAPGVGAALDPLIADLFPYRVLHSLGRDGKALLSRWPIVSEHLVQPEVGHNIQRARIDFGGVELLVHNVHPSASIALLGRWSADEAVLLQSAKEAASHPRGILVGDFNLTPLARSYGRIQSSDLRNAFAEAGHGLGLSFPLFGRYRGVPLPPFVRIDHVWVSKAFAIQSAALGPDGGSDHLPLDVVLLVP
jgi:endonuclease/exonuclease/phosphatase family metal-dependent hydrolase